MTMRRNVAIRMDKIKNILISYLKRKVLNINGAKMGVSTINTKRTAIQGNTQM